MKKRPPVTAASRALKAAGVDYSDHLYTYEERGGTSVSSRELGVEEHKVIKTLLFEDDQRRPLVVLMHGDYQVSTKALARALGARSASPCAPEVAEKHSGYKVGGTSPFGLRKSLPVFAESTIRELDKIYLNGGSRGYLIGLSPGEIERVLKPTWVEIARSH